MNLEWLIFGLRILTTLILYTFLGIAFYIIWRDLKQASGRRLDTSRVAYRLRVIAPAEDESLAVGESLPLQPETLLGRDPDNTIVLNDSSTSGHHARISRENGVWWLEDLSSRGGTLLNELPLSKPTSLTNGDVIGIGDLRFRLELGQEQLI